ncbi:hypothetical protein SUDANB178_00107 [Streptomyces sp. enrichment culture]
MSGGFAGVSPGPPGDTRIGVESQHSRVELMRFDEQVTIDLIDVGRGIVCDAALCATRSSWASARIAFSVSDAVTAVIRPARS